MAWLKRLVGLSKEGEARPEAPAPSPPPSPPSPSNAPKPAAKKGTKVTKKRTPSNPQEDSRKIYLRGQERQSKGDLKGAMREYNKAIELHPENVDALTNRGIVREATGDMAGAKADYAKSIELQIRNEINRQLDSQ